MTRSLSRKRKEERKFLEKKKARVRKQALKEERNPLSKADRAKAESPQKPNFSEEREERKYLLTQSG